MENRLYMALAFGALAGMRSLAAPMLLSHYLNRNRSHALQHTPLRFLENRTADLALKGLAAGEIIGDKLPGAPDRIILPSVLVRSVSGALVGAAIYMMHNGRAYEGATIGAAAAVGATYGSFYLRRYLSTHTRIADPVIGLLEDALVVGSGMRAAHL